MALSEEAIDKVEKALGEPVFIYFSDEVLRIRRNLIFIASITLAYKLSGAKIESFNPFGITFSKFAPSFVDEALFFLLLYSFIHFFWQSVDALQEWRIRITGTRLVFQTAARWGAAEADSPNDPRQSSLMNWWVQEAKKIGAYSNVIKEVAGAVNNFNATLSGNQNVDDIRPLIESHRNQLTGLGSTLEKIKETLASKRIPVSLARFEKWFRMFGYSQLARFAIMEWGLPVVLSLAAMYLVFPWTVFKC